MGRQESISSNTYDVYDFDHTVYDGDCSLDFYKFCVGKKPLLIRYLLGQIWHLVLFRLKVEDRTTFKERFFGFLRGIDDVDGILDLFWSENYKKIKGWYADADHAGDIIISASPEFLLLPAANKLKVAKLIATRMNSKTGEIEGENCRGEEKVRRLRAAMGEAKIGKVYTDHMSDKPLLDLAEKGYIVRKHKVSELPD